MLTDAIRGIVAPAYLAGRTLEVDPKTNGLILDTDEKIYVGLNVPWKLKEERNIYGSDGIYLSTKEPEGYKQIPGLEILERQRIYAALGDPKGDPWFVIAPGMDVSNEALAEAAKYMNHCQPESTTDVGPFREIYLLTNKDLYKLENSCGCGPNYPKCKPTFEGYDHLKWLLEDIKEIGKRVANRRLGELYIIHGCATALRFEEDLPTIREEIAEIDQLIAENFPKR